MRKSIHPGILTILGACLWVSYYIIGGVIGSLFALTGLLLFLFGIAGLIQGSKESDNNAWKDEQEEITGEINDKLTHLYSSTISNKEKEQRAYEIIDATSLPREDKQEIWDNFKNALGK